MRFLLSVLFLLVLCGVTLGDPPPAWPPPSYVMERQWQNIMDYGAVGNGTTDDRAAIQAALDAVGDSGGIVFVPHSDSGFLIKAKLVIKEYTTLLGGGRGSKIIADTSLPPFTMIENTYAGGGPPYDTGIVIDGIFWDGSENHIVYDSTDSASIIELRWAQKCVVRNCFFTRSDKDGVGVRYSKDCRIVNNTFWEMGEEGVVFTKSTGKYNIVSDNHFIMRDSSYIGQSGIYAGGLPAAILLASTHATISNNVFRYGGGGVDMDQVVAPTVPNDSSDTAYCIIITDNQFISIYTNNCISPERPYNVIISNNTFRDCYAPGVYAWAPGDWTQGQGVPDTTAHDIIITDNQFLNHHTVAIRALSGHGYQITNNVFSDLDTTAIMCAGDRSVITGNRITGVTSGYGIHVTAQEHSIISNNQISYVGGSGLRVEMFAGLDEYLSINGNTIAYCGLGIDLVNVDLSTIIGNVCVDNDSAGIYATNCYHNIVALNICTSSPDSTQDYGILFEASANMNTVHDNILGGNTVSPMSGMDGNLEYANRLDTVGVFRFLFHGNVGIGGSNPQVSLVIDTIAPRILLNATDTGGIAAGNAEITFDSAGTLGFSIIFTADSTAAFLIRNHMTTTNAISIARTGQVTFNEAISIPIGDGTAGYVWATNGAGEMVWVPNDTGAGAGGEANTISDTGTYNETEGFGVAGGKTGVSLKVKGLIEGSNITIAKSGDSGLIITGAAGGGGLWAFRDSTTIVYVNDSTGDTNVFIQDTTGFRGLRVSGIMTDTLTVNNYMKVPYIYADEVGTYKIRIFDTVVFSSSAVRPSYSPNQTYYADSNFITLNQVQKIAGDSAAGETNTLGDTGTFNGTEGFGLAGGKTGTVLKVKGLIEGSNITIAASGDSAYTITGSAGGSAVEILESNVSKDDPLVILNLMSGFDITVANDTCYVTFDFTEDKVNLTPGAETEVTGVLGVENGGTETNTLTDGGILLGSGTGAITALGEAANGQIPIGDGTTDPVLNEIDGTANEVTVTNGAGTITLSLPNDAGTDISVDLEEETHASEHEDTGGDEIAVTAGMMNTGTGASSSTYWRGDNSWATPGGAAWNWTDSTGFLVGWGGVAKSVVNDTNYFRFEGSSDFDTTGGSVSLADDAVDPVVLNDSNVQAQGDIVTIAASSQFGFKTIAELGLLTGNETITLSGDATGTGATAITVVVVDDLHNHVYSNIDATTSGNWATRVSDEVGTGAWVFGTSPTFTTDITSPLVIGGTATTSDLSLKTTSGVGATGADMHFLVGNNGATEAMTILNSGNVGIGITNPSSITHIKGNTAGTVGSHPAGQLIIQNPTASVVSNVAITAYSSDVGGAPNQQLWYLGSTSSSNSNITFLNRRSAFLSLGTNDLTRLTISETGNIGIGQTSPDEILHLFANNAALKLEDDSENDATISVGNSQLCIAIDPDNLVVSSDICFDIDGNEVARFHASTNFGIGTLSPPERLSVVGNVATGDTATGDVDVYHYFSTNGSYITEYLKWDDGLARFELSDDLDITGNLTVSGTVPAAWNWADSAGEPPFWVDSANYADTAGVAIYAEDPFFIGHVTLTGQLNQWGVINKLDLANARADHADDYLKLPQYYAGWDADDSAKCLPCDSTRQLHPAFMYIGTGIFTSPSDTLTNGMRRFNKRLLGCGPYCIGENDENPHFLVKDEKYNWHEFFVGPESTWMCTGGAQGDSVPVGYDDSTAKNPIYAKEDSIFFYGDDSSSADSSWTLSAGGNHCSDQALFPGHDGKLYMPYRGSWSVGGPDTHMVAVGWTTNGYQWSSPRIILSDGLCEARGDTAPDAFGIFEFMSPTILVDTGQTYEMWTIERQGEATSSDTTYIVKWEAPKADSGWRFVDTCHYVGTETDAWPWHMRVKRRGLDELYAFVSEYRQGLAGDSTILVIAVSYDDGMTWTATDTTMTAGTDPWNNAGVYLGDGAWVNDGGRDYFEFYVSAKGAYPGNCIEQTELHFEQEYVTADKIGDTADVLRSEMQVEIEDSLNEYSLTSAIEALIEDSLNKYLLLAGGAMTGAITTNSTFDTVDVGALAAKVHKEDLNHFMFTLADPDALYATDHEWSIDPRTAQAITIDSFTVSLDADPTTELTFSLKFADAFIGFANAVVIDDTATVAGVTTVTGGFGDATVPAGKCIYWLFDADPDDAITQASVKIYYSID